MTDVAIVAGEQLLIQIGDGGSPETFTHSCLINTTRGISSPLEPDRDRGARLRRPEPASQDRAQGQVDRLHPVRRRQDRRHLGVGLHPVVAVRRLPKNCKVNQNLSGAAGGWTGTGQLILKQFKTGGDRGDYQDFTAEFVPAAPFVFTQNA
jgi:hypothetical protein